MKGVALEKGRAQNKVWEKKKKALLLKAASILTFPIQREAKKKMVSFFLVSPSGSISD